MIARKTLTRANRGLESENRPDADNMILDYYQRQV